MLFLTLQKKHIVTRTTWVLYDVSKKVHKILNVLRYKWYGSPNYAIWIPILFRINFVWLQAHVVINVNSILLQIDCLSTDWLSWFNHCHLVLPRGSLIIILWRFDDFFFFKMSKFYDVSLNPRFKPVKNSALFLFVIDFDTALPEGCFQNTTHATYFGLNNIGFQGINLVVKNI